MGPPGSNELTTGDCHQVMRLCINDVMNLDLHEILKTCVFGKYTFKITITSPREHWVNPSTYTSLAAHQSRVTAVRYIEQSNWMLSCGRDKYFQWHCTETGRRLGGYQTNAWCTCLQYPWKSSGKLALLILLSSVFLVRWAWWDQFFCL